MQATIGSVVMVKAPGTPADGLCGRLARAQYGRDGCVRFAHVVVKEDYPRYEVSVRARDIQLIG